MKINETERHTIKREWDRGKETDIRRKKRENKKKGGDKGKIQISKRDRKSG